MRRLVLGSASPGCVCRLAVRPGFEPGPRAPKARVLPLHHRTPSPKLINLAFRANRNSEADSGSASGAGRWRSPPGRRLGRLGRPTRQGTRNSRRQRTKPRLAGDGVEELRRPPGQRECGDTETARAELVGVWSWVNTAQVIFMIMLIRFPKFTILREFQIDGARLLLL